MVADDQIFGCQIEAEHSEQKPPNNIDCVVHTGHSQHEQHPADYEVTESSHPYWKPILCHFQTQYHRDACVP